ncbi:hypothetical protein AB0J86_17275 [Micromonospora sp. NPDC049559]|uniref:hypothetical protein n=1 Tax=Micromonospora sp. NPDC049559 TaxID=3155923 RepID=UPI00341DDA62
MTTRRTAVRFLTRLGRGLALPRGFVADGRTLGLGLASALQRQQRASQPTDEEIERFLAGHAGENLSGPTGGDLVSR